MSRPIAHTSTNCLLRHEAGNPVYTYDAHGNMTTMPHLTAITWNYADLLRSAANGTFTSYYVYNAGGGRTRKVVVKGNIREERVYLGNYELYRKYVNNTLDTERQTLHVADDQHRFALIDRLTVNNGGTLTTPTVAVRYQYDNHLGSASLELDQNAAIISYEEYHPFGTTSYRSGRTETEVALKRYKYVGKERDEETGLYYYGARYYAVWIARFVSVDPLQNYYQQLTPFNYAGNKPISYIDIDGMQGEGDEKRSKINQDNTQNNEAGAHKLVPLVTMEVIFKKAIENTAKELAIGTSAVVAGIATFIGLILLPENFNSPLEQNEIDPQRDLIFKFKLNILTALDKLPNKDKEKDDDDNNVYIYRAMNMTKDGYPEIPANPLNSKSIISRQLGARESDIAPLRNEDGSVSPGYNKGGMSASIIPSFPDPIINEKINMNKLVVFKIKIDDLVKSGLIVDTDGGTHISIQPMIKMSEEQYQLNIQLTRKLWKPMKKK